MTTESIQCESCRVSFPEADMTLLHYNTNPDAKCRDDEFDASIWLCLGCLDCPPDKKADPVAARCF